MKISSHKDLLVWQQGIHLVKQIYELTKKLPKHELFGLCSQIRRASISVPANIAEGYGRQHTGEYIRHLTIANGSLQELDTLLEIGCQLEHFEFTDRERFSRMIENEGRMLNSLIRSLRARVGKWPP